MTNGCAFDHGNCLQIYFFCVKSVKQKTSFRKMSKHSSDVFKKSCLNDRQHRHRS